MMLSHRIKVLFALAAVVFGLLLPCTACADEQYDKTNTLLALNMAIVSVKNIVTTQDRIVLDQEYNTIINRLSFGDIESDYELVNLYRDLMDVITQNKLSDEEAKRFAEEYDRRQKKAIVSALSSIRPYGCNMWSFLGSLFTQGVSAYFGYRDAKEQMKEELGEDLWQLEKEKVIRFNDLQKDLLTATWNLLRKYHLPDKYRNTQEDLNLLEIGLAETDKENAAQIFRELESKFSAYPPFWFYYGDAAYRCGDPETALKCFDQFDKAWRHVLRQDAYKVQIAKYRLMIEQNLSKERIIALLNNIKDNSGPREWLDNLFYGAVAFSVGEKDKAIRAVNNNILFKAEMDISPIVLASMKSGKLNMSTLPKDIAVAVANITGLDAEQKKAEEQTQKSLAVGQTVSFGRYWQAVPLQGKQKNDLSQFVDDWPQFVDDEKKDTRTPIEWLVVAEYVGRFLLVSKYGLDCKTYHNERKAVTWENSNLRRWLNSEFYYVAFTSGERSKIVQVVNQNPNNAKSGTSGGNPTRDKVFLLSIDESNRFFSNDKARVCKVTEYAKLHGAWVDSQGCVWWWLRSPGSNDYYAANVHSVGSVDASGLNVNFDYFCVRPALWVSNL